MVNKNTSKFQLPKLKKLAPKNYIDFNHAVETTPYDIHLGLTATQMKSEKRMGKKKEESKKIIFSKDSNLNQFLIKSESIKTPNIIRNTLMIDSLNESHFPLHKRNSKSNNWVINFVDGKINETLDFNFITLNNKSIKRGLIGHSVSNLFKNRNRVKNNSIYSKNQFFLP